MSNYDIYLDYVFLRKQSDGCVWIVFFNEKDFLEKHLKALDNQTKKIDIFIINNWWNFNQLKELATNFKDLNINFISLKNNLWAAWALYFFTKIAIENWYKYVIFADIDAIPVDKNLIENLTKEYKNWYNHIIPKWLERPWSTTYLFHYHLISSEIIKDIGYPSIDMFMRKDDSEYSQRIKNYKKLKSKIVNNFISHPVIKGSNNSFWYYFIARNSLFFYKKYGKLKNYFIEWLAYLLLALIEFFVYWNKKATKAILKWIKDWLLNNVSVKTNLDFMKHTEEFNDSLDTSTLEKKKLQNLDLKDFTIFLYPWYSDFLQINRVKFKWVWKLLSSNYFGWNKLIFPFFKELYLIENDNNDIIILKQNLFFNIIKLLVVIFLYFLLLPTYSIILLIFYFIKSKDES